MRKGRDGSYPEVANYNWTPMSMTGDWLDQLVWNTYRMSAELGCRTVFFDGGYGGMCGRGLHAGPCRGRAALLVAAVPLDEEGRAGTVRRVRRGWGGSFHFGPVGKEVEEMPWWFANGVINPPELPGKEAGAGPAPAAPGLCRRFAAGLDRLERAPPGRPFFANFLQDERTSRPGGAQEPPPRVGQVGLRRSRLAVRRRPQGGIPQ